MNYIPLQSIINFLEDEGHKAYVQNSDPEKYSITLDDPFIDDTKHRMGISRVYIEQTSKYVTLFNGFKSSALLGDDYKGDFYKFVKLLKEFNNVYEATEYFDYNYIYPNFSAEELINLNIDNRIIEQYEEKQDSAVYFPESFETYNIYKKEHFQHTKYLMGERNIKPIILKHKKIFIDHYTNRIVFPVYENNKLVFYTKRSIDPKEKYKWIKLKNTKNVLPIWNLENVGLEIYIFEGIFDAIHFKNGVATFGSFWNEKLRDKILLKKPYKIVVFMDNDIYGKLAKIKILEDLSKHHENIYFYNYKNIKEKDFGEIIENDGEIEENRIIKWNYANKVKYKLGVFE